MQDIPGTKNIKNHVYYIKTKNDKGNTVQDTYVWYKTVEMTKEIQYRIRTYCTKQKK